MRRIMVLVTVALVMAALMALSALPVLAVNSGNQPPGPPTVSGSPTAVLIMVDPVANNSQHGRTSLPHPQS